MAFEKQNRQPKVGAYPEERQIKTGGDPESFETQTIGWQFHRMDGSHEKWGWNELKAKKWREILRSLKGFEGMTWAEIKEASGGKKPGRGTNHHSLKISELNADARKRVEQLHLEQYDKVFSLRMTNTLRLYGIRDGRIMRLLWYDPHHGTSSGVCPTK